MSGPVDVLAVLRKASRSVPNEDFVAFDDAILAVAELIKADRDFDAADKCRSLALANVGRAS